jgi:hypothetical protein
MFRIIMFVISDSQTKLHSLLSEVPNFSKLCYHASYEGPLHKFAVAILLLVIVSPRASGDMFDINLDREKDSSNIWNTTECSMQPGLLSTG